MQNAPNQFLSQLNSLLITNFGHNEKTMDTDIINGHQVAITPRLTALYVALILAAEYDSSTQQLAPKGLPNKALSQLYPLFHPHTQSISFSKYIPLYTSCLLHIRYSFTFSPIHCPEFHYHKNHGLLA
jgi:hypothetical protein